MAMVIEYAAFHPRRQGFFELTHGARENPAHARFTQAKTLGDQILPDAMNVFQNDGCS